MSSPINKLNKQLETLSNAFDAFRETGIDEEIFIAYIIYKTRLAKKTVMDMLHAQEEFFEKLVVKHTVEQI